MLEVFSSCAFNIFKELRKLDNFGILIRVLRRLDYQESMPIGCT